MAGVTQLRLRLLEQCLLYMRFVDRVAIRAADVVQQMLRARKIAVLGAEFVTIKATAAGFRSGELFKADDLAGVAAGIRMLLAGAVAGFAASPFRAAILH